MYFWLSVKSDFIITYTWLETGDDGVLLIKIAMCKEALVSFLAPWNLMIILELGGEIIPIVQVQHLQSTILVSEEEPHKKTL